MSKIMVMATLRLNDANLLEDWRAISQHINKDLENVEGFISRDSVMAKDGLVYCILKWESKAHQEAFMKSLESREDFGAIMQDFARVVDVGNMTKEFFEVL